ncbi:redox-active disulfide protein 2 [Dehalogenimonas lykanthroporepellens BL-DC-9]|jgi:small redox-active disulfide protein 2|nr:redox-active disulfide protein 2 [Dehalogenimonas lykanthroporepellens BL-DC-9]
MKIKILGTGCAKCNQLESLTREAVQELGLEADIEKVKDIERIMEYPVMLTPALVVNEKLVLSGKVPSKADLVEVIAKAVGRKT